MSAIFTETRHYYTSDEGVQKVAPAKSVIFDHAEDEMLERGLRDGHLREATDGEQAEADPVAFAKSKGKPATKARAKKGAEVKTETAVGEDTQPGDDDESLA